MSKILDPMFRRMNRVMKLTPRYFKEILNNCDRAEDNHIPDCEIERVFSYYIFKEFWRLWGDGCHKI